MTAEPRTIPPPSPPGPRSLPDVVSGGLLSLGVGALSGAVAGFLWGGIGGRVAMRILFLTSDPSVRGLTSDDGFTIGQISAASIFLIGAMTILGAMLGAGYGLVRMLLRNPTWLNATGVAVALGAGAGSVIVSPDGIDFRVLEPLWLAVGLFVALPAAWAFTVTVLTERLIHHPALVGDQARGVDDRPLGRFGSAVVWTGLTTITVLGIIDLVNDIDVLL